MSIIRWEPFRDLVSTHDHFNQLFNETFARAFGNQQEVSPRAWVPPVDIGETEDSLVLKADMRAGFTGQLTEKVQRVEERLSAQQ